MAVAGGPEARASSAPAGWPAPVKVEDGAPTIRVVDLEALTREYFAAMGDVQVESILELFDDDGRYEVRGTVGPVDKVGYEAYLRQVRARVRSIRFTIEDLTVKRNIVFVQWGAVGEDVRGEPFEYHGVHVLSWNQRGKVTHVTSLIEPATLQRLVGRF